jgi:hypothetical protein
MEAQHSIGTQLWAGILGIALLCGACSDPGGSYEATCLGQGYKTGTTEFDACVRQQDIARYGDRRPVLRGTVAPSSW